MALHFGLLRSKNMRIEEIRYGDYTAKINVSKGGNCISLCNSRHNCSILREPDYERGLDSPYLYGIPILFPVNRISRGTFEFEGRTYVFPINEENTNCFLHGTLHDAPFEVEHQEENRILLCYQATGELPYLSFPHAFEIRMEYSLSTEGLLQEVEIRNLSSENMPVFLGFHTAFRLPFAKGSKREALKVKVDIVKEYERNMSVYLPTGGILEFDEVSKSLADGSFVPDKPVSRHYRSGEWGRMSITDPDRSLTVVYENCPEFAFRLIYGQGSDFICLEPQTCMADCANAPFPREETGFGYVKPGEKKRYWSKIRLENVDR